MREVEGLDAVFGVLLCQNGAVYASADGGATWTRQSVVKGAAALSWETTLEGSLLQRGSETCRGLQFLRSVNVGRNWQTGGCIGDESAASSRSPSPSLDFVDANVGMALVDGVVFTTTDGGESWREPAP